MNNFLGGGGDSDSALKNGTEDLFVNSLKINNLTANLPIKTDSNKSIYSTLLSISDVENLQDALDNPIGCVLLNEPTTQIMQGDIQIPVGEASVVIGSGLYTLQGDVSTLTSNVADKVSKTETALQTLAGDINLPYSLGNVNVGDALAVLIPKTNGHTQQIYTLQNKTVYISADAFRTTVDSTLQINGGITDSNGDESFILKKAPGVGSYQMGLATTTGTDINSLSIGFFVGDSTNTKVDNIIIGNTSGTTMGVGANSNVIIGSAAAPTVIGDHNVVVGRGAGSGSVGTSNTYIGGGSANLSTGDSNSYLGAFAGVNISSGSSNTMLGSAASGLNTGDNQIAIGYQATTTTSHQCVIGNTDLAQVQSDGFRDLDVKSDNILAVGKSTASKVEIGKVGAITEIKGDLTCGGNINVDGTYKNNGQNGILAITSNGGTGTLTLSENNLSAITGGFNTVIGNDSGTSLIGGTENTIIGYQAGQGVNARNTVCIGYLSGQYTNGGNNVYIGTQTGQGISTGSNTDCNVAIGSNSMKVITTGDNNVAIGCNSAVTLTEGIRNVCIGDFSALQPTLANQIAIGYLATTTDNNQCVIGSPALAQFQSNGFKDLDVKSDNILAIGKTLASKVEIGKVGAITEIKGNLTVPSINTLTAVGGKFSALVPLTYQNTTLQTSLISTGVGTVLFPANTLNLGDTFNIRMTGIVKSKTAGDTLLIRNIFQVDITSVAYTIHTSDYVPFTLDLTITFTSIGPTGTTKLVSDGGMTIGDTRISFYQPTIKQLSSTVPQTWQTLATWGNADPDNILIVRSFTITKTY
jgi:hypothetical protein